MTDERNYAFLEVAEMIRSKYARHEYEKAEHARDMHAMVGYPSDPDFKKMIRCGLIHNCNVTTKDIDNALEIFGKSIYKLKGKTTRKKPDQVT